MTTESGDDEIQTAIESPIQELHPLKHKWAFWYLEGDRSKDWNDCLKKIAVIGSVEEFWAVYFNALPASELSSLSDYYLFKEGIEPKWEHPQNINGGRWLVSIDKRKRDHDELWLNLMMLLTCEEFEDYGEFVCGAAFNSRGRANKFCLWTADATLDEVNRQIALVYLDNLELQSDNLRYDLHQISSCRANPPNDNSKTKRTVSESHNEDPQKTQDELEEKTLLPTGDHLNDEAQDKPEDQPKDEDQLENGDQPKDEDQLKDEDPVQIEH
jgi:translation initiation factor 4E